MFTGIVSALGSVAHVERNSRVMRVAVDSGYQPDSVEIGASIAHDGCCLTVVMREPQGDGMRHWVDVAAESLDKTTLGEWRVGDGVNLERSLRVGDELGGHWVLGHVDGVGEVQSVDFYPGAGQRMVFKAPDEIMPLIALKGSIAVHGVSLTVNGVQEGSFDVMIIPHTLVATTLSKLQAGSKVNLEADMMARYAARLIEARSS